MPNKKQEENSKNNEDIVVGEDIIIEADEDNLKESSFNGETKRIREKLKKCTFEKQEYLNGWQREKADLINLKKDFEEQKKDFVKFAKGDLISQIVPVLDSFDMAFKNTEGVPEQWLKGVEHIHNQFLFILEENGVEQINPEGEKFDVTKHIAMESVKIDDEKKDGTILEVIQKGYELNGKVLREAKVKVGEYKI